MRRVAIVCIDHMASSAARRSEVSGMIISAEEVQCRIHQPSFLKTKQNRVRPIGSAESASAQALVGFAWIFVLVGQTDFQPPLAPTFKYAQHVAGLRDFPTRDRIQEVEQTTRAFLFCAWSWSLNESLRLASRTITLSKARVFDRHAA